MFVFKLQEILFKVLLLCKNILLILSCYGTQMELSFQFKEVELLVPFSLPHHLISYTSSVKKRRENTNKVNRFFRIFITHFNCEFQREMITGHHWRPLIDSQGPLRFSKPDKNMKQRNTSVFQPISSTNCD